MLKRKTQSSKTTTADALLGLLSLSPMSGYDMRQVMSWSTDHFWQESYGQIYPTLKQLEERKLIEICGASAGGEKRQSKVYSLTESGREQLDQWLQSPSQPQTARNELLLKVFFSGVVPIEVVRKQLIAFESLHSEALTKYALTEERLRREEGHDRRFPLWLITLRYGQAESEGILKWVQGALEICDLVENGQSV